MAAFQALAAPPPISFQVIHSPFHQSTSSRPTRSYEVRQAQPLASLGSIAGTICFLRKRYHLRRLLKLSNRSKDLTSMKAEFISVPVTDTKEGYEEPKSYCKKGNNVEVLAPSNRWREAKVVKIHNDGVTVHYSGYDAQFDERIDFNSSRLRKYGGLHGQMLQDLRAGFVYQEVKGSCPGCGIPLQCTDPLALGYIPSDKFAPQEDETEALKPLKAEDEVKLLLQEDGVEEIDRVVLSKRANQASFKVVAQVILDIRKEPDINAERVEGESLAFGDTFAVSEIYRNADARSYFRLADGRGWVFDWTLVRGARLQLVAPVDDGLAMIKKKVQKSKQAVCQRCWGLWHYNDCDDIYRPMYGGHRGTGKTLEDLSAKKFKDLVTSTLKPVKEGCVLAVVDVFDFGPSFTMLEFLAEQLKEKPDIRVRVVANKVDLLPKDASIPRIRGWVATEARKAGLERVKITDVFPVSCHTGAGVKDVSQLLQKVDAPKEHYLIGAANAGKSSLLNRLTLRKRRGVGEVADEDACGFMVSALPGTTLRPLVMKFQEGKTKLIDMPGLLIPGSFAERLTLEDLKVVLPQKASARRVTLRMDEGRSILLGAAARIDFVTGRPFQFTVFAHEKLTPHRCRTQDSLRIAQKFAGISLVPPVASKRFPMLQPWVTHRFELKGTGWNEACADIVFHGLGWVSVTGCGECVVEAQAPEGVSVTMRDPLMPFEAKWTGVKYDGRPGWFRIRGKITRAFEVGKARFGVKGRF